MFKRTKVCAGVLAALGGGLAGISTPVAAQQAGERIEITGSAIKRIDAESALPVQVLTRDDIARTSASTVEQLLQTISANSSSGGLTASSASGATTGGISAISLRALGPQRTLILINGRRVAPYGVGLTNDSVSVDVNSIPLAAIERVEVLKEGASSLYGSDAIAGVVNFILRRELRGVDVAAEYGRPTKDSKGDLKRGTISFGFGDLSADRFNVYLGASYQKESALFGRDRKFSRTAINEAELNDTTSGNTFPANIAAADGSLGSRNPTAATGCVAPYSRIDPLFGSRSCRFDPASLVTLLPETERTSFFGAGKFAITPELEAFLEASYTHNKQNTVIQPVPISDQFTIPANNPLANTAPYNTYTVKPSSTIILRPSSPYYPRSYVTGQTGGATPDLFVRYRASLSGDRDLTDKSNAPRLTFGVRGGVGGWDLDSAFLYSQSKVTEVVNDGYPIYSKILPLLNSGTVNFFGASPQSIVDQIRASNFTGDAFNVKSELMSLTAKVSREVMQLPGGGLGIAFGGELRKEKYDYKPSIELQQGDVSGYGGNFGAVKKSRDVESAFVEVNAPVIRSLELGAGVRFDHYESVGNSTTPKATFRWQPVSQFLFRGSAGKGFRAPSLQDLYAPQTDGVSQTGLSDPRRCPTTGDGIRDCATQFGTTNGGNPNLNPEKSRNFTLGIVLQPVTDLSIGVDAFHIKLTDTISQGLPQAFLLANLDKYSSFVVRGPAQPAFPNLPGPIISLSQANLNLGSTKAMGADFDVRYKVAAGPAGRFTLGVAGTYYGKYKTENPDGTFASQVGNLEASTTGGVIPRWKSYQSVLWEFGPVEVYAAYNWQSHYRDVPGNFQDPDDPAYHVRNVSSYGLFDLQTTYTGIKNLRLTLGARNLLNRDPPYTNQGFSFQSGYDPQYGDPRGRFVYARVSYSFK